MSTKFLHFTQSLSMSENFYRIFYAYHRTGGFIRRAIGSKTFALKQRNPPAWSVFSTPTDFLIEPAFNCPFLTKNFVIAYFNKIAYKSLSLPCFLFVFVLKTINFWPRKFRQVKRQAPPISMILFCMGSVKCFNSPEHNSGIKILAML